MEAGMQLIREAGVFEQPWRMGLLSMQKNLSFQWFLIKEGSPVIRVDRLDPV